MNAPEEIIVDAGPLIALVRERDNKHQECLEALKSLPSGVRMITTVSVLAEAFAILPSNKGTLTAMQTLLLGIPLRLHYIQDNELPRVFDLMAKYVDLPMDFADAELLVIAERRGIKRIFTLDKRDFSIYRPRHVRRLQIIP